MYNFFEIWSTRSAFEDHTIHKRNHYLNVSVVYNPRLKLIQIIRNKTYIRFKHFLSVYITVVIISYCHDVIVDFAMKIESNIFIERRSFVGYSSNGRVSITSK